MVTQMNSTIQPKTLQDRHYVYNTSPYSQNKGCSSRNNSLLRLRNCREGGYISFPLSIHITTIYAAVGTVCNRYSKMEVKNSTGFIKNRVECCNATTLYYLYSTSLQLYKITLYLYSCHRLNPAQTKV